MIDLLIGVGLAAMVFRGWSRGLVREVLDLVGLVAGIWIAFRLSGPMASFLEDGFGVSPEVARIGGGILLFVLFGVGMTVAAHFLSRFMSLPGLSLINRVGGVAMAVAWGVALAFVLLSLVRVLPLPDDWKVEVDESRAADVIIGEEAIPRQVFETVAGDDVMAAAAAIQDIFGVARAVPQGTETFAFPPSEADEIRQVRDEASDLVESINEYRLGRDQRALVSVAPLTALAEERATEMYTAGSLGRIEDCFAELAASGHRVAACDNMVALAATSSAGIDAIIESPGGVAALGLRNADRVGVAVVDGGMGRLVVVVVAA